MNAPIGFPLARGNRQALAPFCTATFEYQPPILRAHPHDESMGAATMTQIGLKSALHRNIKCYRRREKPVNAPDAF
jgi:hypothetical protein